MSAWGAPAGAWANAVEEEEQENGGIEVPVAKEEEFPSLGAAVAPAASKKGKKKKQTMSLGEFVSGGGPGPAARADLLMSLPTAPRARQQGDAEAEGGETLGGAFKSYGGGQQQRGRFDRDERPPRRGPREDDMPSRADATDDWGSERKFVPSGGAGGGGFDRERRGFGGGFREERPPRDEPSRADLANDWGANRPRFPSPRGHPRRDGSRERFSRADQEARWGHRSDAPPTAFDDRPRRGFNDDWRQADDQQNGSSEAPKERPKLKLKPRSKPIDQSSDAQPRASIFGGAKPREEILKERPSSVTTDDVEEKIENLNVNAD